jgi:hypothetical protein
VAVLITMDYNQTLGFAVGGRPSHGFARVCSPFGLRYPSSLYGFARVCSPFGLRYPSSL